MATRTFSTRIPGIDAAGDDPFLPCLVLGILEDASFHPEGAFAIAATTIHAFLWFELAQMLEDENGGFMLLSKLDNASTHLMRKVLIGMFDLAPEVYIVLFPVGDETRLATIAGNASKLLLPKAGYRLTTTDERGSQDRTFNCLDATHGQ